MVSFLSFGIYFANSINNDEDEITCINADFVSDNASQDGIRVINNFRFLRNQLFFKKLSNNKNLILWCDSGTHFKNSEFMYYLFKELKDEGVIVEWNLFQDKHGLLKFLVIF